MCGNHNHNRNQTWAKSWQASSYLILIALSREVVISPSYCCTNWGSEIRWPVQVYTVGTLAELLNFILASVNTMGEFGKGTLVIIRDYCLLLSRTWSMLDACFQSIPMVLMPIYLFIYLFLAVQNIYYSRNDFFYEYTLSGLLKLK